MNVMLTCAGRRCFLLQAFKEALWGEGLTFACDSNAGAPALRCADQAFLVPEVNSGHYIESLLALCEEHEVGLLVPAMEPELPLLAARRSDFHRIGTIVLVSPPAIIATCYDKLATGHFLDSCGLLSPLTFDGLESAQEAVARDAVRYPLVVKPRWGVSSIGVELAGDARDLERVYLATQRQIARSFLAAVSATDPHHSVLIQEHLTGTEYGLDIVNDLQGNYVSTLSKRKLRMRAGQTDQAITVQDERLESLGQTIGQGLRHLGLLDADVYITERGCHVLDLNPRIGGGYAFSHLAGANFPSAALAWARGHLPNPKWLQVEPGVASSRCDDFLVTQRPDLPDTLRFEADLPVNSHSQSTYL